MHWNKRPMGHIAHRRNQFKSINTFAQSYDRLYHKIDWGKKTSSIYDYNTGPYICKTLSPFHPKMLYVKFGRIWLNGSEEDF